MKIYVMIFFLFQQENDPFSAQGLVSVHDQNEVVHNKFILMGYSAHLKF